MQTFPKKPKLPPRGDGDILDIIRRAVPDMKDAEAKAARIVLTDSEWIIESSIKVVADRAGVSEPTVLRMCRRVGLDGFKALKYRLTEDLALTRVLFNSEQAPIDASPNELVKVLLNTTMRALRDLTNTLDIGVLDEAAEAVVKARMTYCMGVGGSSAVLAEELENRMFRLGIAAQAVPDPYRQRMAAAIATSNDLFVAISSTGVPASVVESIELARSNGAMTLAITQPDSPLAKVSEVVLFVEPFDDETFFMLPSRTRYAQLFMIDCLMGTIAARIPGAASNLKSIRDTLRAHHGTIRHQPIGD